MKRYLLIKSDEDGNPFSWLDVDELEELLGDARGTHGVTRFMSGEEAEALGSDTNYWPDGEALLVEVKPVLPVPVTTAWRLP